MKLILLSDFHLMSKTPVSRTDDAFQSSFNKFAYVINYANEKNAHIIQAGDLTHASRDYDVLDKLILHLSLLKENLFFFTIWGQHNQYYRTKVNNATTLGILSCIELATILGEDPKIVYDRYVPNVNIYGCSWGESVPPPKDANGFNILAIHESIGVRKLFPEDDPIDAEIFLKEAEEYDVILCGDIHRKFHIALDGRHILNTGCIFRYTGSEYELNHKPGFYVLDYNKNGDVEIIWEEIPHRTSSDVMSTKHLEAKKYLEDSVSDFINLIEDYKCKQVDTRSNIKKYLTNNNISDNIKNIILKEMENDRE